MKEDWQLFVGQKAFIERDGAVLILNDPKKGLDFPGGKIQEGEIDFAKALQREVMEETGLTIQVGNPFTVWYFTFDKASGHRNAGKHVYLVGFRCTYMKGEVKLSDEHNAFTWVTKETYKKLDDGSNYFEALTKYFEM